MDAQTVAPGARPPLPRVNHKPVVPTSGRGHLIDKGEIARGGMGSIRCVLDTGVIRDLAMKVFDPSELAAGCRSTRFLEEARISGQLEHPNIVPVHEVSLRPDGTPAYFTMKLVQGETFSKVIRARPPGQRTHEELEHHLRIFLKVCDALAFAHCRGVVHRDLKPSNVMVGSHGQVYLMDWGLAMVIPPERTPSGRAPEARVTLRLGSTEGNLDAPGTVAGTGAYMAPEQAWGQVDRIDARTDVFGLGAILYEVLTGSPPYKGSGGFDSIILAQKGQIEPPQVRVGKDIELPPELCRITMRALASSPDQRYPAVDALKADVERALRGGLWLSTTVFAAGELVVREGEHGDAAYIIQDGRCEAFKTEGDLRVPLRSMGPGEVFGETAVFTAQPRTAGVEATTTLVVRVVTREALENELAASPSIAAFTRALAERFRDLDGRLARSREDALVDRHLRDYVCFEGRIVDHGVAEACWSRLCSRLGEQLGLSADGLLAAVARSSDLVVYPERDAIRACSCLRD